MSTLLLRVDAAGGGGMDPASLAGYILDLWAAHLSASPVALWPDASPSAADAASVNSPVWEAAGLNGRASVLLNGSSQYLENTATSLIASHSAWTLVVVGQATYSGGGALFTVRRSLAYASSWAFNSGNCYVAAQGDLGAALLAIADGSFNTSPFVMLWRYYGTAQLPDIYVNGTARAIISGTVQATETGSTGFQVGTDQEGRAWPGRIGRILAYNRALTDPEITGITATLKTYYGIP